MILAMLYGLLGCASHSPDDSFDITMFDSSKEQLDISHFQSPCLDGVIKNMADRDCEISVSTVNAHMIRYTCLQSSQEINDAWTTRTFSSWTISDLPDKDFLDRNGYKLACTDWSLSIFYR